MSRIRHAPIYGRAIYDEAVYGSLSTNANYTETPKTEANWNLSLRHTYGYEARTTTRILFGDYVRYGGIVKVPYKFIKRPDYL